MENLIRILPGLKSMGQQKAGGQVSKGKMGNPSSEKNYSYLDYQYQHPGCDTVL